MPGAQRQQYATDYIDVASRIVEFRGKYPDGSLQPADLTRPFQVLQIGDQTFIAVVAAAYRTPDDARPGVGMAYEVFPGRTNFTRGSELQNAETSAWGRAIVAALAADTKAGISSAEEIRNRQAEQDERQELPPSRPADRAQGTQARAVHPLTDEGKDALSDLLATDDPDQVRTLWREIRAAGKPQTVTLDMIGADEAAALGIAGPLDLFEVATKVGEHLKDNGISVREHVAALAAPEPAGGGERMVPADPELTSELRKAARGQNGGQQT